MVADFIYYVREYGFSIAWSFRKAIFWNWHDYDQVIPQAVDNDGGVIAAIECWLELEELGY